jgi:O-antigen/teichoic acid export membrane protein
MANKGGFAVLDQALFAGTNFLVGILLARWLDTTAYGAFALAYSIFLFTGTLHTALWTEPMLVYGSGRFKDEYKKYQKVLLDFHWRFGFVLIVIFSSFSIIFRVINEAELGRSFTGLAIASPLILFLWLVRRSAYVLLKPQYAAMGGGVYLALYLGISILLFRYQILNETTALVAMGVASLISGNLIQANIKGIATRAGEGDAVSSSAIQALHWSYGRWALVAGGLSWVPINVYFIVLPFLKGLDASANLKALLNLVQPILHFNSAIASMFVPAFVRAIHSGTLRKKVQMSAGFIVSSALLFWLFLPFGGEWLTKSLYNNRYVFSSQFFILLGMVPVVVAIANTLGAVLRALDLPREVAISYIYAAMGAMLLGVPLTYWLGIQGALIGMIVSCVLLVVRLVGGLSSVALNFGKNRSGMKDSY